MVQIPPPPLPHTDTLTSDPHSTPEMTLKEITYEYILSQTPTERLNGDRGQPIIKLPFSGWYLIVNKWPNDNTNFEILNVNSLLKIEINYYGLTITFPMVHSLTPSVTLTQKPKPDNERSYLFKINNFNLNETEIGEFDTPVRDRNLQKIFINYDNIKEIIDSKNLIPTELNTPPTSYKENPLEAVKGEQMSITGN